MRDVIIATLEGSDICHAEGQEVVHNAPALKMCRVLCELGYDPLRPMHVFRGQELAMTIKSIGWGAKYTVAEDPNVHLVRYRPFPKKGPLPSRGEPQD